MTDKPTELERLTKRLFSDNSVRKLVNFKLFRGDDITTTQEQLCAEINSALDQVNIERERRETIQRIFDQSEIFKGNKMIRSLDGHLTVTNINDFIKAKLD